MQPYQEAGERTRQSGQGAINTVKYAGAAALGTGASMAARGIIKRMIPLLSSYIPEDLARKALEKIDPRIGNFVNKAESDGFDFNEIKDYLNTKIQTSEEKAGPKEDRDIISQYSPNLYQYISDLIKNGSSPTEAAVKAKKFLDPKHKKLIQQIEKDHKTPWTSIVESIFGSGANSSQTQINSPESLINSVQTQNTQGQNGQNSQGGPGQQALMAILAQINQKLGQ